MIMVLYCMAAEKLDQQKIQYTIYYKLAKNSTQNVSVNECGINLCITNA